MDQFIKILQDNPNGAFATVNGNRAAVRPWQFQFYEDGRFYFGTGNVKDVYRQMQANGNVAFTSTSPEMVTVRLIGEAVFIADNEIKQQMLDRNPVLKRIYASGDDPVFEVFYIEHGEAIIQDFAGNPPRKFDF